MKGRFRYYIQELLTFSKSEKRSILFLSVMILVVILSMHLFPLISSNKDLGNIGEVRKQIEAFEKRIASDTSVQKQKTPYKRKEKVALAELNSIDSASLVHLSCIGPFIASRIVKFRRTLGGYSSVMQLCEVWGIKEWQWKCIKGFFWVDTSKVIGIPVNTATFKEINAHPYISFEQTKQIFRIRKTCKISELNQLTAVFTREELDRVRPYLRFE